MTPAFVTLSDDDEASTRIVLSAVPARVSEGAGPTPVAVTATLDQGLRQTATAVTVSVAGGGDPDTVDFDPVGDFRITIPANAASGSGTFVLRPEDDRNVESDDTLAVSGVSDLPVTSASVALADDDEVSTRILLFLTVNPAQASEGGGPVEVTVAAAVDKGVRPSPTRVAVTVTASGDPLAVDFAPVPDFEIVIPANAPEGTATFTVTPEDDMIVERDEVVTVAGTSDLPVTKAVLSLLDDDEAGGILLAALPVRVTEGGGPVAVEVTASLAGSVRQHATTVTVSVSGSGDPTAVDFNPVADFAIVIAAGSASGSGTFMLTPEDDREDESDESLTISGASDLPVTPTSVSIIDDDESAPPALSVADASVAEGAAELAFVVDLDAPSSEEVTVRYGSADATAEAGSDYEPVSGTLAFAPGEVSKTVRVVVLDDELDEPDETLTLGLSHPRNATLARASASGTILDDDDPPVLSIAGASGMEGDGQLDFVISLSAPSIAEVTVRYATRDGTAAAGSDYRPVDGTMTFAPGQVAMTASVAVIDDTLDEVDEETFAVALSANTGASLDRAADRATATGVIVDDDDPPEVTVDDAAGDETVGSLAFVVSLGGPSAVDVAVDYATADDTATAGRDYEARSGTLSFAPGTVARTVLVPVLNDTEDEPDETFVVTLSDPRNASLAVSSATGTIIDDDESAPPALSVADASVAEGAAELAFVVDLDAPSSEEVTVRYGSADATAEAGSDYEPVSGTLAFAPGEVSKTVRVVVLDDELDEPDETLTLGLSHPRNATLARASASGTILDDDDPPVLSIAGASGMEGDGQLDFVISLSAPSIAEVTVRYATRDGTAAAGSDYRPVDGTMTFAPGQVAMTASVAVIDDTLDEVDEETFAVALSANTGASLDRAADRATATGVIVDDDDPPEVTVDDAAGDETVGSLAFVVSLGGPSAVDVAVDYATADDTATAGRDYEARSGTLSFAPGTVARTVLVPVLNDTEDEPDETFVVTLSDPRNASLAVSSATGTIIDDDESAPPALSVADASVAEGAAELAFVVDLDAPSSEEVTVRYGSADATAEAGSDYEPVSGTLAFAPGEVSKTVRVVVLDDELDEPDETLTLGLSHPRNATLARASASGTILDDDDPPVLSIAGASGMEGDGQLDFVISLSAPSIAEVTVRYATRDGTAAAGSDYRPVDGTMTFAPGQVAMTASVAVIDDTLDEVDEETFAVALSANTGASLDRAADRATATGVIVDDDDPPEVTVDDAAGDETVGSLAFVVSLGGPSAVDVAVDYATADDTATAGRDYEARSGTLSFAPGTVARTVLVPVLNDTEDEPDETFVVTLSDPRNASLAVSSATGTIIDDDESAPPALSVADASVAEGAAELAFVVDLDAPSSEEVTVRYGSADATAEAGSDYEPVSGTLAFAPGEVSKTVRVVVLDDELDEPDETLTLGLSHPRNATLARASASGTILDDDDPPVLSIAGASGMEGDGQLDFVISLSAPSLAEVTVRYATRDGTAAAGSDYRPVDGTMTFAPGQVAMTASVAVIDDTLDEVDEETFAVALSANTGASLDRAADRATATGVIVDDDDPPEVTVDDAAGDETVGSLAFVVSLGGPSAVDVAVDYATADDTATAGRDYEARSGTLSFAPGEVSKTVRVVVLDDELDEPDETLTLGLSHPRNATLARASASGTILDDDDPPVLSIAGASGMEGDGQLDFVISLSAPSIAEVTVRYATRDGTAAAGSDYRPVDGTMTFAPGQVAMTASVAVIDDTLDEVDEETFAVALSANTGASLDRAADRATATGVIVDDDDPPEVTVDDAAGDETVGSLAFVVSLGGPSAVDVAVDYATADDTATAGRDYEARSGTLSFAPGTVTRTILVPVLDDAEDEPDETFVLALDDPRNATLADGSATGTIRDDDPSAPDLAGGFPNAALCVGGAPFELDLAGHFEGEQITFSVVSSAPGVATAVIAGTQLTVLPVAEGTAMVTVTASNPAGTSSGEVAVRVVADPAELAAVDAVLASIGRGVLSSVTASVGDRFAQRSAFREEEPIRDAGAFMGAPEIPASPLADRTGRRGGIPTGHDPFGDLRNDRLRTPGRSAGFPRRGMAPFSFSLAGQAGGSGSAALSWSAWGRGDQRRIEGGASGTSHDATLSGVHLGADVGGDDWLGGVSVLHSRAEADYRFDRSVDACGGGGTGEGILDAELTSIHPYGGRRIGRGWIWASVGVGGGEVSVERCKSGQVGDADVSMRLAAVGGRHPFAFGEQLAVSVVEEVGVVTVTTGSAAGPAGNRSVTAGLARIGLEAAGVTPLECKCSLSTYVRAFARGDWGDGATGAGLELAAGVRYRNLPRRLGIDAGIRALAVHSAEDAAERSANLTFSILPRADGTGLQASLAWQQQASDVRLDALGGISRWTAPAMDLPDAERHWIARSRLGYGIALRRGSADTRGIAMPFVEFDAAPSERGSARFGVRHEFGDRVRGLVVEWRIEQRSFPGAGNRIVLEVLGQF